MNELVDHRFDDRTALVTGAAGGIGAATARRLAALGANVVVTDIDGDGARSVAAAITDDGGTAIAEQLDVGDSDAWDRVRTLAKTEFGPVSVVVNNAFTVVLQPAHETSDADFLRQLDVNVGSVHRSIRSFHDDLVGSAGAIVNVASVHADLGFPLHPGYAAAKGAIVALTQQLAVEYGPHLRVNAVLPGPIDTAAWKHSDDAAIDEAARGTALERLGRPDEVAGAITFLASDAASYVTGASLHVDGGYVVRKVLA